MVLGALPCAVGAAASDLPGVHEPVARILAKIHAQFPEDAARNRLV
jgi:hypothetical protein